MRFSRVRAVTEVSVTDLDGIGIAAPAVVPSPAPDRQLTPARE